ncbi:AAA family ATPase [Actinoplanes sp. NPDC049596]|uniref:AAA family ATPase n=1 Tax=unclassified Actinoplanes TaxID=2626549 RepID=UPI00343B0B76
MPLLEREHAFASLDDYARDPEVGLVLIAGEAGVGKTSLVEALRSHSGALWA